VPVRQREEVQEVLPAVSRSLRAALPPNLRPALEPAPSSNPSGRDPTATLTFEFERAPFTIWLTPSGDVQSLDVWLDFEVAAVLNLCWSGDVLTLGFFSRGEWERQLLELARQHE
jgi:hypothetical protein